MKALDTPLIQAIITDLDRKANNGWAEWTPRFPRNLTEAQVLKELAAAKKLHQKYMTPNQ